MEIKILGTGCPKCKTLEKAAYNMVSELGIEATIIKVDDIMKIMEKGPLWLCCSPARRCRCPTCWSFAALWAQKKRWFMYCL